MYDVEYAGWKARIKEMTNESQRERVARKAQSAQSPLTCTAKIWQHFIIFLKIQDSPRPVEETTASTESQHA